ncbi:GNAT family N-acetyltransferase [Paenibacillus campi]|uniref:GNAT family N-acetyltransferase n=1 Tax=Paenibacillus campi TaxID=3106031 RepID=UPI002AFED09E|nr:GNAT family N-acetyltransferase [Paenibacillus sp. SGZ-1014]
MIVTLEQAIKIYNLLPPHRRSFYFHPEYLKADVRNKEGVELQFFVVQQDNFIFYHAFYRGKVPNTELYDIQSPYGYGGPIIVGDHQFRIKAIGLYKEWCVENYILVEFIRFHPLLKNNSYYEGAVHFNRTVVYIDLNVDDIWADFSSMARRAVRKAIKNNVNIIFSKEYRYIEGFVKIYEDSMQEKSAEQAYFFDTDYYKQIIQQDQVVLVSAVNENGETLAASLFFIEDHLAEYHLSATTEEGKRLRAANLIIYSFAQYAQQYGCQYVYLGGGSSTNCEDSLFFFKKSFSKQETDYYIGSTVYMPDKYNEMKKNATNGRILFYKGLN